MPSDDLTHYMEATSRLTARVAELESLLTPFANAADQLDKWMGGPPMPAHAFEEECRAARDALRCEVCKGSGDDPSACPGCEEDCSVCKGTGRKQPVDRSYLDLVHLLSNARGPIGALVRAWDEGKHLIMTETGMVVSEPRRRESAQMVLDCTDVRFLREASAA